LYLKSDNSNAAIYYAIGNEEILIDDAHLYKGAFEINENMTVRAIAVKSGFVNSSVMSVTFTIADTLSDWGDVVEEDRKRFSDADSVDQGIWVSGFGDRAYNGTAIVFESLRVYYHKTMLTAGTDYTVKYSNNVNASTDKATAIITVTGKGNYTGSRKVPFNIMPLSLGTAGKNSESVVISDVSKEYNGKIQKLKTTVLYRINDTDEYITLKEGKDFTYDYSRVAAAANDYTVKVVGKGNYTGEATFIESIFEKGTRTDISKLKVKSIKAQNATGEEIEPELEITDSAKGYILVNHEDYEAEYFNNVAAGTATVVITGTGDSYTGTKTLTFKIKGIAISKAKLEAEKYVFTGSEIIPEFTVTYQAGKNAPVEELNAPDDFEVSYSNNINKGKGRIVLKGHGRFTGTVTRTFTIEQCNFADGDVYVNSVEYPAYTSNNASYDFGVYTYTKGGVKPEFTITYNDQVLELGKDFTVKFSKNNTVGGTGKNSPYFTVTGKGNYKGKFTRTFDIEESSLDEVEVTASDIKWANKAGICKPTITVVDSNGTKLAAGKDYDSKHIEYIYASNATITRGKAEVPVTGGVDAVDLKKDIIPVGTEIMVVIHGKGNYDKDSSQTAVFTYVDELISKATIKPLTGTFTYTGGGIEISEKDLSVKIGKSVLPLGSYRITGFDANVNKGTAKVTIAGAGLYGGKYYGGSKTVTFKIVAKSIK
ncbi:MAG: chitobiase/beta-hexosaminidase C-terminal domain-containing protein, partial [Butyrivibrio sp.]|nr:chitobiase/beta-hexosaminidase C-terminal domain-containing protein [Butyrivibrio sp.]